MLKSIFSFFAALSLLSSASALLPESGCNGTQYLEVTLWDAFGDGWDDAYWMMRDPGGVTSKEQSTCWEIEKVFLVQPCVRDPMDGFYYMIANTMDESLPKGWWEINWKVEVYWNNGTSTGEWHYGVYNTTMVWEYNSVSDRWSLTHHDPIPNFECDGCSGGPCKPKPKPKPKTKPKSDKGKGDEKGDEDESETIPSNSSTSSEGTKYGPRAVDLEVKMFSEQNEVGECNGWRDITEMWDDETPIYAHWYIADYSLTKLFDDGSLCEGCSGSCKICLGDGSYVFRVTGPTFNETDEHKWWEEAGLEVTEGEDLDTRDHSILDHYRASYDAWEFCHAKGFYNDQLNFHVKKGKCIPDNLRWADELCDAEETTVVVAVGVLSLKGISDDLFRGYDAYIVKHVLSETVSGWSESKITIIEASIDTKALSVSRRGLDSYSHDVEFTVSFVAEDFGIDGSTYRNVESLVSDMAATLEASITSGAFINVLAGEAQLSHVSHLGEATGATLLSMNIQSISYEHNHLQYVYDVENPAASVSTGSSNFHSNSLSVSNYLMIVGVVVCVIALVAFVGIVTHGFSKGYNKLPIESTSGQQQTQQSTTAFDEESEVNPFSSTEEPRRKIFR